LQPAQPQPIIASINTSNAYGKLPNTAKVELQSSVPSTESNGVSYPSPVLVSPVGTPRVASKNTLTKEVARTNFLLQSKTTALPLKSRPEETVLTSLVPGRIKRLVIDQSQDPEQSPLFNRENRAKILSGTPLLDKPKTGIIRPKIVIPDGSPSDDESTEKMDTLLPYIEQTLNHLPILKKEDYFTIPSIEEMKVMTFDELSAIPKFTIGCKSKGQVTFQTPTNVLNLNLDDIVIFEDYTIEIYPDDTSKPPPGEGLNKPAVLTIYGCWPKDKQTGSIRKDPQNFMRYEKVLRNKCLKMGAKFLSYESPDGSWSFRVEGF